MYQTTPPAAYWQSQLVEWGPRVLFAILILVVTHFVAKAVQWGVARMIDKVPILKRDPRVGGECRVAAREDEAQLVIRHGAHFRFWLWFTDEGHRLRLPACPGGLAAQPVKGLVPGGRDDPATRVGRHAVGRPAFESDREGFLDRVFGEVNVAEDAGQGGHRAARALPEGPYESGFRCGHFDLRPSP